MAIFLSCLVWNEDNIHSKAAKSKAKAKLQTGARKTGRRLYTLSMKHNQAQTETEN